MSTAVHRSQINIADLAPYLTYGIKRRYTARLPSWFNRKTEYFTHQPRPLARLLLSCNFVDRIAPIFILSSP
jgi:hypothetical protein